MEPRFLIVGQTAQGVWAATVTYRHEETIRLVSICRARDGEKRQDAREGRHEARNDPG
jgi:uncharacterized DUF497 family protein